MSYRVVGKGLGNMQRTVEGTPVQQAILGLKSNFARPFFTMPHPGSSLSSHRCANHPTPPCGYLLNVQPAISH